MVDDIGDRLVFGVKNLYDTLSDTLILKDINKEDFFFLDEALINVCARNCQDMLTDNSIDPKSIENLAGSKKKRTTLPRSTRQFLDEVFNKKSNPNRAERYIIAQKSGLTPLQVRVWVCIGSKCDLFASTN